MVGMRIFVCLCLYECMYGWYVWMCEGDVCVRVYV